MDELVVCMECGESFVIDNILAKQEYDCCGTCTKCRKVIMEGINITFKDKDDNSIIIEFNAKEEQNTSKAFMVAAAVFFLITEADEQMVKLIDDKIREMMTSEEDKDESTC